MPPPEQQTAQSPPPASSRAAPATSIGAGRGLASKDVMLPPRDQTPGVRHRVFGGTEAVGIVLILANAADLGDRGFRLDQGGDGRVATHLVQVAAAGGPDAADGDAQPDADLGGR